MSTRWLAKKITSLSTASLSILKARMNILSIIKVKILVLIKRAYKSLNHVDCISLVIMFWTHSPITFRHTSFWNPFLEPTLEHPTYHGMRHVCLRDDGLGGGWRGDNLSIECALPCWDTWCFISSNFLLYKERPTPQFRELGLLCPHTALR